MFSAEKDSDRTAWIRLIVHFKYSYWYRPYTRALDGEDGPYDVPSALPMITGGRCSVVKIVRLRGPMHPGSTGLLNYSRRIFTVATAGISVVHAACIHSLLAILVRVVATVLLSSSRFYAAAAAIAQHFDVILTGYTHSVIHLSSTTPQF